MKLDIPGINDDSLVQVIKDNSITLHDGYLERSINMKQTRTLDVEETDIIFDKLCYSKRTVQSVLMSLAEKYYFICVEFIASDPLIVYYEKNELELAKAHREALMLWAFDS